MLSRAKKKLEIDDQLKAFEAKLRGDLPAGGESIGVGPPPYVEETPVGISTVKNDQEL